MTSNFHGVTASTKFLRTGTHDPFPGGSDARWAHNAWRMTLRLDDRRMQVQYFTGINHGEPTASDVLDSLTGDAHTAESVFEDWAADLGYDVDSRKAALTYRAVIRQTERLRKFLADRFDEFLALEF